ncbi:Sec8 exocyst complex component-specific domain-domain-containing protein [Protomyces lactucae-debilis]|uniref:Exocyst complex component Sec8 n=1 Tax=Protomyces lactucae-debilis TaxID=2754530 RepID=A0A1Y2F7Y8_PROLT|nr:Sec8 exocyst complex component-specific domain-containing protein [Protomyces lactucae-debilis]ORY80018.1 Sec8 exocyst complex component-specific domain-domain-containing protein [Protomyces lactucae-debilis]
MSYARRGILDDDDDEEEDDHNWRSLSRNATTVNRRNGVSKTTNDTLGEIRGIIQSEWAETLQPDFRPIGLALDMVDTSSLGRRRDLERFRRTNQDIERALQSTVNEHYQGFNSSIGTYGQVTGAIATSQRQVGATRDALHRAKAQLSTHRDDLLDLSERSRQYNDMISLLKDIARLRGIPEQLEAHLSAKQFLKAVHCFNEASAIAHRQEMINIAALADIRQYLKSQSVSLVEILLEELHNHLYLRSPYCDNRWAAYTVGQTDLPIISLDGRSSLRLPLEDHRAKRQGEQHVAVDQHPERDSFTYVSTVLEALYIFGKLPYAMDIVAQRMPSQIHTLFGSTVDQVRARHGSKRSSANSKPDLTDLLDRDDESTEPLRDLFWTLFSKVDAMLQAHSNLCETLLALRDRFGGRAAAGSAVEYDFAEVWKPLGSELRSLLGQYILDKSASLESVKQGNVNMNVFREPARNKTKQLFDFMDQSGRHESVAQAEEEQLRSMLHDSVPGLIADGPDLRNNSVVLTAESGPIAASTPFNIAIIMSPTVALLSRAKRIIPQGSSVSASAIDAFLDELISKLVAPQLTELLDDATRSALSGTLRPLHNVSKGSPSDLADFLMVLARFSTLIEQVAYKREQYADMMLGSMLAYLQKVQSHFGLCTANPQQDNHKLGALRLGPSWACRAEIVELWQPFLQRQYFEASELYTIAAQEQDILRQLRKQTQVERGDLIMDGRTIHNLAHLYGNVKHFMAAARKFHQDSKTRPSWINETKKDSSLPATLKRLEMNTTGAGKFDSIMAAFQRVLVDILLTLRIELHVQVLFFVQQSLKHSNYDIDEPAVEADPIILDLVKQIDLFNEVSVQHLSSDESEFVLASLATFIDDLFIDESELIGTLSAAGAQKVGLHILAIQQHLRNLVSSPELADLGPAKLFFDLFEATPLGLIEVASSSGGLPFAYEHAAKLLRLQHSRDLQQAQGQQNGTNRASRDGSRRKLLDEHLILLSEAMWKVDEVGGGQ